MILEKIEKLIDRYEKELKEGDYSIVDGSSELERIIEDLKYIIKKHFEEEYGDDPLDRDDNDDEIIG